MIPDAIILAGGLGTRLRGVLPDTPKVLASVAGRPFLSYILDQLSRFGVKRAVLCVGYKSELVEASFGTSYKGITIVYSYEKQLLGTGGALRLALPLICTKYA